MAVDGIRLGTSSLTVWRPFAILVSREVVALWRQKVRLSSRIALLALATVFVFDFIMPQLSGGVGVAQGYATVLAPGLIAVGTCNQALTATLTSLTSDFGPLRRIDQLLMAPVPVPLLAVVRIIGGGLNGVFAACVTAPVVFLVHAPGAPPAIDMSRWHLLVGTVVIAGLMFAALGIVLGTTVNPAKAGLLLPYGLPLMIMLGCVYYPWSSLAVIPWLHYLVLINPVVYVTEAARASIAPQFGHLSGTAILWVLTVTTILATALGVARFTGKTRQ
jgi:ABC-2 type transport system permease protein